MASIAELDRLNRFFKRISRMASTMIIARHSPSPPRRNHMIFESAACVNFIERSRVVCFSVV